MVALTFFAYTCEDVENKMLFFTDATKVRRFRISFDLEAEAISVDEHVNELRAVDGKRVEFARWRPFLRKSGQDGGQQHILVPKPSHGEVFHVHRNVGPQTVRATPQDAALDPGWESERVDKVNLRLHWPMQRGAARPMHVKLVDFAVGQPITIFGRVFHISDASAETRDYFARMGMPLTPAVEVPGDEYIMRQEALLAAERERKTVARDGVDFLEHHRHWRAAPKPSLREHRAEKGSSYGNAHTTAAFGNEAARPAAQFRHAPQVFAAQGRVLRFWLRPDVAAAPDELEQSRGVPQPARTLLLRYCLDRSSSAVEVVEALELASGTHLKADAPVLIRARRDWCEQREMTAGGERPNAPHPSELRVGQWLWLDAQRYFVLACDEPTREWLKAQGADPMPPNFALDYSPHARARAAEERPYGVAIGRRGFDPLVRPGPAVRPNVPGESRPTLRFLARLADAPHSGHPAAQRLFVLSVPPDLRLSVREVPQPNSGRPGGLVLRPPLPTEPVGHAYALSDFRLGAIVELPGLRLLIHDAEEATFAWQESEPQTFPQSDIHAVLEAHACQLSEQLRVRANAVPWACGVDGRMEGVVDLDGMLRLLRAVSTPPFDPLVGMTMAEAVTVFRAFREPGRQLVDLAMLQRALERSAQSFNSDN